MAKILENSIVTPFIRRNRFIRPEPMINRCGCGKPAKYEVYNTRQKHCQDCMLEAVETSVYVEVRCLEGNYDDAS